MLSDDSRHNYGYDRAMNGAAGGGRQDIVNQMLLLGAKDYNSAMKSAARGGHQDIVDQMQALIDSNR